MSERDAIRQTLLRLLADGSPVARAALLHEIAAQRGVDPRQRRLRAQVSCALRELEDQGLIVDGGPEVWLDPRRQPG